MTKQDSGITEASSDSVEVSGQNKHTPGPWAFYPKLTESANFKSFGVIENARWTVIAEVSTRNPNISEGPANAALISAAPELLEALIQAVHHLRQTPIMWAKPIDDADAAIRKATSVGRGNAALTPPGKPKSVAATAKAKVADTFMKIQSQFWR